MLFNPFDECELYYTVIISIVKSYFIAIDCTIKLFLWSGVVTTVRVAIPLREHWYYTRETKTNYMSCLYCAHCLKLPDHHRPSKSLWVAPIGGVSGSASSMILATCSNGLMCRTLAKSSCS